MSFLSNLKYLLEPLPKPKERCPVCGYITLRERGQWQICGVCFWEDGMDVDTDDEPSGCNHEMNLREARENYLNHRACDKKFRKYVRPEKYGAPPLG